MRLDMTAEVILIGNANGISLSRDCDRLLSCPALENVSFVGGASSAVKSRYNGRGEAGNVEPSSGTANNSSERGGVMVVAIAVRIGDYFAAGVKPKPHDVRAVWYAYRGKYASARQ